MHHARTLLTRAIIVSLLVVCSLAAGASATDVPAPGQSTAAAAALAAETGSPGAEPVPTPFDDIDSLAGRYVAAHDERCPFHRFDGSDGSLFLGPGWAPPERNSDFMFAWALGRRAEMWFLRPPRNERYDLFVTCQPFLFPDRPDQVLRAAVNGRDIGAVSLGDPWDDYRVEIPEGVIKPGLNRLELTFSTATLPAEVSSSSDRRPLSAAFRLVALVPRDVARLGDCHVQSMLAPAMRLFEVAEGGMVSLPLPVTGTTRLRFAAVLPSTPELRLRLAVVAREQPDRDIWFGPASEADGQVFDLGSCGQRACALRLTVLGDDNGATPPGAKVTIALADASLQVVPEAAPELVRRPNVFVYVVDTVRRDALSLHGNSRRTSPRLEAFARDAVVYDQAVAASSWTLPSVASLLTGRYPTRHGAILGDVLYDPARAANAPMLLAHRGYDSVGISHSSVVSATLGLDRGFASFFIADFLNSTELRTPRARRVLTQWLRGRSDWTRPIFAYLHTVAAHEPYTPTGRYARWAETTPGTLAPDMYWLEQFITGGHGADAAEVDHLRVR